MFTGRVVGTVVATRKDPRLLGRTLLVVQPVDASGRNRGGLIVAADTAGAGVGETVLLCRSGDAARVTNLSPVDAAIIGIVDSMYAVDAADG